MLIETSFIIGVGVLLLCMLLIIAILGYLYFTVSKALFVLEKEFTHYKSTSEEQSRKALLEAQNKANQIISETKLFTEDIKQNLNSKAAASISEGTSSYNSLINDLEKKTSEQIETIGKEMEEKSIEETKKINEELKVMMENEQSKYIKELSAQKEKEFTEIKSKVISLLPEILSEAAALSISKEEQEKIALEAISKIKTKYGL